MVEAMNGQQAAEIDLPALMKWNRPVPRYTSYPTAVQFKPIGLLDAEQALKRFDQSQLPLSLYLHIPFCKTMCLFCGCSVILNRSPQRQAAYVDLLCQEIRLFASKLSHRKQATQLHFGGGTPTNLSEEEFERVFEELHRVFEIKGEISIEIDPRTVADDEGRKLRFLKKLGFNRVSFGVQDLDPEVQEAVRRRQSEEMTVKTYELAREIGFSGINLDLIYGLPYQTCERFSRTARRISELKPDRIALFSYAKVPWLKAHQKAMPEEAEPSSKEKLAIYIDARNRFLEAGYCQIGMDHFCLGTDTLSSALREKTLTRNFQGYSIKAADDLAGFGITSIGKIGGAFLQNVKTIEEYAKEIGASRLPVHRGIVMGKEDLLRSYVIEKLMCHFELDKQEFEHLYRESFDKHFNECQPALSALQNQGLLENTDQKIVPTSLGQIFIRIIASVFDAYLTPEQQQFSQSI